MGRRRKPQGPTSQPAPELTIAELVALIDAEPVDVEPDQVVPAHVVEDRDPWDVSMDEVWAMADENTSKPG